MKHSPPADVVQQNASPHREQQIDAINQAFALFRLNFHAQFFKAFSVEAELTQVKKLWLGELERFQPRVLLQAAKAILETSDYLPTLHTMIRHCERLSNSTNLPDSHSAYLEACRAASPKARFEWSHPAVYFAGKACDWYFLQTSSENIAYPVFKKKYQDLCERVQAGEKLVLATESALPYAPAAAPDKQQNIEKLKALREALNL